MVMNSIALTFIEQIQRRRAFLSLNPEHLLLVCPALKMRSNL